MTRVPDAARERILDLNARRMEKTGRTLAGAAEVTNATLTAAPNLRSFR